MLRTIGFTVLCILSLVSPVHAKTWTFVTKPFPPFSSEADATKTGQPGPHAGPFARIILRVCSELKQPCRIQVYPWRRALQLAEKGHVEGLYSLVPYATRDRDFYLCRNLVRTSNGLYVRRDRRFSYQSFSDLAGYHIVAYSPSATAEQVQRLLPRAKGAKLVTEADNLRMLRKLSSGRYGRQAVVVINRDVADYLLKHERIDNLVEVGTLGALDFTLGLSRHALSAKDALLFDQTLRRLYQNGTLQPLLRDAGLHPAP